MKPIDLTDDAKAILMLCGRFHTADIQDAPKPLNLREYNRLADWMKACRIRPEDLLTDAGRQLLDRAPASIDSDRIRSLLSRGASMSFAIEKWTNAGIWVICRSDAHYPERLKQHLKKKAPPILYGIGDTRLLNRGGMAIVGSRNVNASGEIFTRQVGEACARQGIQIVSGGARGVDEIAMLAALNAGGTVVGMLANSLLKAAVAKKYRAGIRERRLVLATAFSPEAGFNVGNAMGRNKHIYAMADAALIISAEVEKGGTWAGATEELKRTIPRPVFVRDEADAPSGNRALIKLGAQPFPLPPWGKDLAPLLINKPAADRQPVRAQMSIFGQTASSPTPATLVKDTEKDYEGGLNECGKKPPVDALRETSRPDSIYKAVLPVLLGALEDWQPAKDLIRILDVRKFQLYDWLSRAVDDGVVEKKERPVLYRRRR